MRPADTPSAELLLIRHAQSRWNASGRWQGHADPPLSELGREQAAALAQRLCGERVDALYASDLGRARETAQIVGAALGLELETFPELRELYLGHWQGLTRTQIQERWPDALGAFDSGRFDARPTGGETRRELEARVRDRLARIVARHPGGRIAVVSHRGVIATLLPGALLGNADYRRTTFGGAATG